MIEVCFCTYQRYERVPEIIRQLESQTFQDFKINIWNNSQQKIDTSGSDRVSVISSSKNLGSQARFKLVPITTGKEIVFIDDDVILSQDFLEHIYNKYMELGKDVVVGSHTRTFNSESYWKKARSSANSEVDYIATKGMLIGRDIFDKEIRLQAIPESFQRAEDLYLCYLARTKYGKKLFNIPSKLEDISDGKDQWKDLKKYKEESFKKLRKKGWKLIRELQ